MNQVTPYEGNPRQIDEKHSSGLKASLSRFGYVDLIVWNERTGNIVGGHQRYNVLVEQGVKEASMIVVDFSENDEIAANLTLNNPLIEGDWDDPIHDLISQIQASDPEFFHNANFEDLRKSVERMIPPVEEDDTDTECPCCGNRWKISDEDIKLMDETEKQCILEGDDE